MPNFGPSYSYGIKSTVDPKSLHVDELNIRNFENFREDRGLNPV